MEDVEVLVLLELLRAGHVLIDLTVHYKLSGLTGACKHSCRLSDKLESRLPTQVDDPPGECLYDLRTCLVVLTGIELKDRYTHSIVAVKSLQNWKIIVRISNRDR